MKVVRLMVNLFYTDRQSDGLTVLRNLMVAFRKNVNASNKIGNFYVSCSVFK